MKVKHIVLIVTLSLFYLSTNGQIPTRGLIAWYPFNGNTNDSTINANNLTNSNVTFTSDRFGNKDASVFFINGCSTCLPSYLYKPAFHIRDLFSYSVWIKPTSLFQLALIFYNSTLSDSAGFGLLLNGYPKDSGSKLGLMQGDVVDMSVYNELDYSWRHVVITHSKGLGYSFFADGKFIGKESLYPSSDTDSGLFVIGGTPMMGPPHYFYLYNGAIDDIRIYNRALSASEIDSLYHEGGYNDSLTAVSINATVPYKVYPNPMSEQLTIENIANGTGVIIYDIMGRIVFKGAVNADKYFINTADLAKGFYLLELTDNYGRRRNMTVLKR